jgi:hypothetical protein
MGGMPLHFDERTGRGQQIVAGGGDLRAGDERAVSDSLKCGTQGIGKKFQPFLIST